MTRAKWAFVTLFLISAALVVFHIGALVMPATVALFCFEAISISSLASLVMAIRGED